VAAAARANYLLAMVEILVVRVVAVEITLLAAQGIPQAQAHHKEIMVAHQL
jgi:hypothetical protein